jgi:arsenate reductase
MSVTIWHNPRCSKSRQTLALIEGRGIRPQVVEYLKQPPSREDIARVVTLLAIAPIELMRRGETVYKELEIGVRPLGDDELIAAMSANPVLIERPVVIANGKAALGRPPENVLNIL